MDASPTGIAGSWLFSPRLHNDPRGVFLEAFTQSSVVTAASRELTVKQTNISVSSRGTVRGIHFADVPPGQAKYVQCHSGRIMDVVVDIRVGSPTFGSWHAVELDSQRRQALFVSEGLGHAFCALSEQATVGYLCSEQYAPTREHGIHPLDPGIGIDWPAEIQLQLSDKDSSALSLAEAEKAGLLPNFTQCQLWIDGLSVNHDSQI